MLLLLLIALGLYFYSTGDLQRFLGNVTSQNGRDHGTDARRALDMRYAAGEISTEEYQKIKNIL